MALIRSAFLDAAGCAARLLHDPAVGRCWDQPSALPRLAVSGLAGHLARQVLGVPRLLAAAPPDSAPIGQLEHYARSRWVGADLDDEISVAIRRDGAEEAAGGAAALASAVRAALVGLAEALPAEPPDRVVHLPWGPWSLSLDDFLVTRMFEIAVHLDDLAVSVGEPTPTLPDAALEPVLGLLSALAVRRHGATAVLRAFSRAERAPDTIAAI